MLQILLVSFIPAYVFSVPTKEFAATLGLTINATMFFFVAIAFIINYAFYFSEIYRAGIEAISVGQYEAGKVLGLKKWQIFKNIVLVQVIKNIVPPIGNEIITLVKDTSIARMIALVELTDIAFDLRKAQGGGLWPLLAAGIFYYVFNAIVAFALSKIEKKLSYIKV
jgi:polar amino acid transport system permease protein